MKIILWVIMSLTMSAGSLASVSSLKGSSLKDRVHESREEERQEEREVKMNSVIGGSLGGASESEVQREEESPLSGESVGDGQPVSCEELRRACD